MHLVAAVTHLIFFSTLLIARKNMVLGELTEKNIFTLDRDKIGVYTPKTEP
jgi:hypothetical protein